ncbi:hypothetical protein AYL99_06875 [Fonsecaea erecta]|uniref:3-hydroxybutyrate dehydrogenase n=1 Tax=Fonsecaea erecta TaxID=1367422 RepID=A0A178ZIG6_9EURO|nr:hypothetical protein AYL99_06875 [Fonsecaea erecta]OAP59577.1 hypothetical protein AYL99_06875 [Fonsecaea erecta]
MQNLQGKVALVTGGGSGISLAFCKLLYKAGCKVLIADIALHGTAKQWLASIQAESPSDAARAKFVRTDVTDWDQLETAFKESEVVLGTQPDIVVPGAGVYEPSSNSFWEDHDLNSRYKVLDIDLVHPIKLTRMAIRHMVQARKAGTIIHISSIAGQRASVVTPLYTAAKHGINSFIRSMGSLEAMAGIRVLGVAPGTVGTPLFTDHPEASKFLDLDKDTLLAPEHVANAMFALLTETQYKGGTVLEVCHETAWREVSLLNDPGPQGPASITSRKSEAIKDILPHLGELDKMVVEGVRTD